MNFERFIQKISAATGRVQHVGSAQLVVELADFGAGFLKLSFGGLAGEFSGFARQHPRGGLGAEPVGAQRLDHGGQHQPFDIGTRRVVRAEGMALGRVEPALQQRAELRRVTCIASAAENSPLSMSAHSTRSNCCSVTGCLR